MRIPKTTAVFLASVAMFTLTLFAFDGRTLRLSDIPPRVVRDEVVPIEWIKATTERRFRIAPIERELADDPPLLDSVVLPACDAFRFEIRKLAVVRMEDRQCWGVLLVSTDKTWLKVKFGGYVPVLTTFAKVGE